MANEITKLNQIAVADLAKINGLTEADVENLNGLEWAGDGIANWDIYLILADATTMMNHNGLAWSNTGHAKLYATGNYTCGVSGTTGFSSHGYISGAPTGISEEYNGSSWSAGGTSGRARYGNRIVGTVTSALAVGGYDGNYRNWTDEYNGSTWSTGSNLPGGYQDAWHGGAGGGTSEISTVFGGYRYSGKTYEYNGSSWSTMSNFSTARQGVTGNSVGSQNDTVLIGGQTASGNVNETEEYTGSSWATGGTTPVALRAVSTMGKGANSCVGIGGYTSTYVNTFYTYNGSSYSTNDVITAQAGPALFGEYDQ
tara:strand:+ start:619 stop:1554 length:936 start_codon:yes stop_codon:yes gene_type:complete